jgi:hypothetical protein
MRSLFFIILFFAAVITQGQNYWPKSYYQPQSYLNDMIRDDDGGYLGLLQIGNFTSLIKFDANTNLVWKKTISFPHSSYLYACRLIKSKDHNLFTAGYYSDPNLNSSRAFVLKLDRCYNKASSIIYADSISTWGQEFLWANDFSDSLILIHGGGFNTFSNQLILSSKSDLLPHNVYNYDGNSWGNIYTDKNSIYLTADDFFYIKGGDTTSGAARATLLKFEASSGNNIFYKFYGFDENIISDSKHIFKNQKNNLNLFSIFRTIVGGTTYKDYTPMVYECDTNGKMLNYRIYSDTLIDQAYNNTLQLNDSTYIVAVTYLQWGQSSSAMERIKLYNLNANGDIRDSFYFNNFGRQYFTKAGFGYLNLIKTFDNKIMCSFLEKDATGANPRITFLKFDDKFKLDTTEFRNLVYDSGCSVLSDTISIDDKNIYYLHTDTTFPELRLTKPVGIIKVPGNYKYSFYPNPIISKAKFEFETITSGVLKIILVDAWGKEVKEIYYQEDLEPGNNIVELNLEGVASGQYYLNTFLNDQAIHTIKIIKE